MGGGGQKRCSHAEEGGPKGFEVVLRWVLEIDAMLKGGGRPQSVHPIREGVCKVLPCLEGEGRNNFSIL